MTLVTKRIILNSSAKNVWEFVTNPKNFSQYVYGYASGRITSRNKTGAGARYVWYGKLGPFRLKSTEEIIKWKEGKYVNYSGKLFWIKFDSSMNVKKVRNDKTLLTVIISYNVPLFLGGITADVLFIQSIVKTCIRNSLQKLNSITFLYCFFICF